MMGETIAKGQLIVFEPEKFLAVYVCGDDKQNPDMMHEYIGISVRDQNISDEDREKIFKQVQDLIGGSMKEYNDKVDDEKKITPYDLKANTFSIIQGDSNECRYADI